MNATVAPSALGDLAGDAALMTAVRRRLHACPELGFAEFRTASTVARPLERWGFAVARGVGGTGVVASLSCGTGRRIGLRAELDALPVVEADRTAAMHACGHDGHMAILLAAARYLARTRRFAGTVRLIFQPAEEGLGGAARMVEDGLFERFPRDALFALHNAPDQRAETVAVRPGVMAAFGDWLEIRVFAGGGHAASGGAGAVVVAAAIVMALQAVVASRTGPFEPAIVHVGALQAGSCAGVSAGSARLLVTVRTLDAACRQRVLAALGEVVRAQAACHAARAELVELCSYPRLVNSVEETRLVIRAAREVVGDGNVFPPGSVGPIMASDDFAVLLARCPGCYFLLGTEGREAMRLHHPGYDFNDDCLRTGASLLARLVEHSLPAAIRPPT